MNPNEAVVASCCWMVILEYDAFVVVVAVPQSGIRHNMYGFVVVVVVVHCVLAACVMSCSFERKDFVCKLHNSSYRSHSVAVVGVVEGGVAVETDSSGPSLAPAVNVASGSPRKDPFGYSSVSSYSRALFLPVWVGCLDGTPVPPSVNPQKNRTSPNREGYLEYRKRRQLVVNPDDDQRTLDLAHVQLL